MKIDEQKVMESRGEPCEASWQVTPVGGAYFIQCRNCKSILQSDCTPKCLLKEPN